MCSFGLLLDGAADWMVLVICSLLFLRGMVFLDKSVDGTQQGKQIIEDTIARMPGLKWLP
eukprot:5722526-Amphidinium_carterae.1